MLGLTVILLQATTMKHTRTYIQSLNGCTGFGTECVFINARRISLPVHILGMCFESTAVFVCGPVLLQYIHSVGRL